MFSYTPYMYIGIEIYERRRQSVTLLPGDTFPDEVETPCRKSHHPEEIKTNLTHRLNRIEGQIRGIKGMVERDVYCDDIITQYWDDMCRLYQSD